MFLICAVTPSLQDLNTRINPIICGRGRYLGIISTLHSSIRHQLICMLDPQVFMSPFLWHSPLAICSLLIYTSVFRSAVQTLSTSSISINPADPLNHHAFAFSPTFQKRKKNNKQKSPIVFSIIIVTAIAHTYTLHIFSEYTSLLLRWCSHSVTCSSSVSFPANLISLSWDAEYRCALRHRRCPRTADRFCFVVSTVWFDIVIVILVFYVIFVMNKFCTFGKSDRLLDKQDTMLLIPEISIPQVKFWYGLRYLCQVIRMVMMRSWKNLVNRVRKSLGEECIKNTFNSKKMYVCMSGRGKGGDIAAAFFLILCKKLLHFRNLIFKYLSKVHQMLLPYGIII